MAIHIPMNSFLNFSPWMRKVTTAGADLKSVPQPLRLKLIIYNEMNTVLLNYNEQKVQIP